jgi:methylthioribose-1-phosphate isomerase
MKRISLGLTYENGTLKVLDQTVLPHQEKWIDCKTPQEMIVCIQKLQIRGAPLIGVGAALSLAQMAHQDKNLEEIKKWAAELRKARPTAVNLMNAVDRVMKETELSKESITARALDIFDQDVLLCEQMAKHGLPLIQDGDGVLTHCNSGGLATAGVGTALGVIINAHLKGKKIHVFVDETRPLLQGARLSAWECEKNQVPYTLLCDNMAGFVMSQKKITRIFVGADRIAINGDFANKIGTYSVAVLAKHHGIPFYVVAPSTTLDLKCLNGSQIPIEERNPDEVRRDFSPRSAPVYNPSFDVTPASLVTGFVFEKGVFKPEEIKVNF